MISEPCSTSEALARIELVAGGFDQLVAAAAENVFAGIVGQPQVAVGGFRLRPELLADDRAVAGGRNAELLLADRARSRAPFFLGFFGEDFRREAADQVFEFVVVGVEDARFAAAGLDAALANDPLDFIDLELPARAVAIAEIAPFERISTTSVRSTPIILAASVRSTNLPAMSPPLIKSQAPGATTIARYPAARGLKQPLASWRHSSLYLVCSFDLQICAGYLVLQ